MELVSAEDGTGFSDEAISGERDFCVAEGLPFFGDFCFCWQQSEHGEEAIAGFDSFRKKHEPAAFRVDGTAIFSERADRVCHRDVCGKS